MLVPSSWNDLKWIAGCAIMVTALDRGTGSWWCGLAFMVGLILWTHAREHERFAKGPTR